MCTLANSEDPGEIMHNAVFHQGLHCLLSQKRLSEKEIQSNLEIIACGTLNFIMDHSDFIVCNFVENGIGPKGLRASIPREQCFLAARPI